MAGAVDSRQSKADEVFFSFFDRYSSLLLLPKFLILYVYLLFKIFLYFGLRQEYLELLNKVSLLLFSA